MTGGGSAITGAMTGAGFLIFRLYAGSIKNNQDKIKLLSLNPEMQGFLSMA